MTWFAFRRDDSAKERDLEVGLKKFLVGTLLLGARLILAYGDRSGTLSNLSFAYMYPTPSYLTDKRLAS